MLLRRVALTLAATAALAVLAGCGSDGSDSATDTSPTQTGGKTTSCTYNAGGQGAKQVDPPSTEAPAEGTFTATLETNVGAIPITLDAGATPCAVNSFISLAEQGYFDDTPCHRLTTQGIFVLQCGDPTGTGTGGPGYSFDDELSGTETYPAGTVAMANAGPDTNGSQFFLVYEDTELPPSYDVIGQMDDAGTELVAKVADKGTADGGPDGPPKESVQIQSVSIG